MHIIGHPSFVSFAYEHFKTKPHAIGLSIQPHNVQHGHPLTYRLNSTFRPSLPPHQKFWWFLWAPHHSHHPSSKMPC